MNFSDLIFYGETTHREDITHGRNVYIVRFKAESLLKEPEGLASGDIPVCENSSFQDTINLGKNPGAFVIFAKRRGPCFSPVAGYKSIIPVADGVARTGAIDEQPETERLDAFIAKIGILLKSAEQ